MDGLSRTPIEWPWFALGVALQLLLLFQSTHPLDVQGVEPAGVVALVRGQVFVAGFQADTTGFADSYHDHAARLAFARLVFFLGECDTNFGDGTRRGTIGVLHQTALFVVHEDRVGFSGGYGQAAFMGRALSIMNGEEGCLFLRLRLALTADHEETTDEDQGDQEEDQQRDQEVHHGTREAIIVVAITGDNLGQIVDHVVDGREVGGGGWSRSVIGLSMDDSDRRS